MNKKVIIALMIASIIGGRVLISRWYSAAHEAKKSPFITTTPLTTTIRHIVSTTGALKIKDSSRVGSLVAGTVQDIFVEENDTVRKGQLLATLDNGKRDTAIRSAQGICEQAAAQYEYEQAVFEREKLLFEEGHRSLQEFQEHERALRSAHGALISARAHLDAAQIEFDNTSIKAPDDGVVIAVGIKKGFKVTTDLEATVLFEIARDTTKMEAELALEESDVSHVKAGQKVTFSVDAYPDKIFKTTIKSVSYAPVKTSGGLIYRAIVEVDNNAGLLYPGMTIHASVKIDKAKDTLAVDNTAFYVDGDHVKALATQHGYTVKEVAAQAKKEARNAEEATKHLWVLRDGVIEEVLLATGVSDDRHIQATSGIDAQDQYILDVLEASAMEKHYKNMFKGAL